MSNLLFTSVSGWVEVGLIVVTVCLPFLLRPSGFSRALGVAKSGVPYLRRLRLHYWLGYLIAGLTLAHAWVSMSAGNIRQVDALGLYLATIAFFLVIGQVALGRYLSDSTIVSRRVGRRWHFWIMVAIVVFGVGHLALNSPAVGALLQW